MCWRSSGAMRRKRILAVAAGCAVLALGALLYVGMQLAQHSRRPVRMQAPFEDVQFQGTHGSLLKARHNARCALLMHPIRGDRRAMAGRAKFLREAGITSLAIDLHAHGETPGAYTTFGLRESNDARNGLAYLRTVQGCGQVVAIGHSLGGVAALVGEGPIAADAFVLEEVFPSIEDAVANRLAMRFGYAGRLAAPLIYLQLPLLTGIALEQVRPVDAIARLKVPVLVVGGMRDEHTPPQETRRLFDAARGDKTLWLVEGAAHEDLYAFDPVQYRARLEGFLAKLPR